MGRGCDRDGGPPRGYYGRGNNHREGRIGVAEEEDDGGGGDSNINRRHRWGNWGGETWASSSLSAAAATYDDDDRVKMMAINDAAQSSSSADDDNQNKVRANFALSMFGRERKVADVLVDHPSLLKQHAVLQYRALPSRGEKNRDGTVMGTALPPKVLCRLYLMDLESTNGTFLNGIRLDPARYYELKRRDVITLALARGSPCCSRNGA